MQQAVQKPSLSGCWLQGIWASVPTPFHEDERLDEAALLHNTEYFTEALGLSGVFCNGIVGEGWSLTIDERMDVVRLTLSASKGRLKVAPVVTAGSLSETVTLAKHAETLGAHHIVLAPPPGLYDESELLRYIDRASSSVSLPVMLLEATSGGFGSSFLERAASECRVISGIKVGNGHDAAVEFHKKYGDALIITDPIEANWLSHLQEGFMDTLYADPEPYLFQSSKRKPIQEYYTAYQNGLEDKARAISAELSDLRKIYAQNILEPLRRGSNPVPALKAWCELTELRVGPPRPPLNPISRSFTRTLENEVLHFWEKLNLI